MRIEWLGHACFRIDHQGYAIVLDPYNPEMMKGYAPIDTAAQAVYCSHQHGDHNYVGAVRIVETNRPSPFAVHRLASFHDDVGGAKRGKNSITILEADGYRIAHLGDLGALPDQDQLRQLQGVDAMLIPVGGYYTIDAQTAKTLVAMTCPKVVIPMHFRGPDYGPSAIATIDAFTSLFARESLQFYATNAMEISRDTQPQIAVLTYLRS